WLNVTTGLINMDNLESKLAPERKGAPPERGEPRRSHINLPNNLLHFSGGERSEFARMKKKCFALLSATAASAILAGCSHLNGHDQKPAPDASAALGDALHALERKYAPDNHM